MFNQNKTSIKNIITKNKIKNNRIYFISIILLLFTITCALLNYFVISFFIIFIYAIINFIIKKRSNDTTSVTRDSDILSFIDNLIKKYKSTNCLFDSIKYANNNNFFFSYALTNSIIKYSLGYGAFNSFSNLNFFNSKYLDQLVILITTGLEDGVDISTSLLDLKNEINISQKKFLKNYGNIKNIQSINTLSTTLFLPLFSGISLNIIKFSSFFNSANNSINKSINLLLINFILYFFIINYINEFKNKKSATLQNFFFCFSLSIVLFLFTFKFVGSIW
jgi:hypothetical protein